VIDTHAHLTMSQFARDLDAVIARARDAGVTKIVTVGTDLEDWDRAVALADRVPDVFAVVGLHPHDSEGWNAEVLRTLEAHCRHPRVKAVGEIGLDFYRDYAARDAQRQAFREQIRLARRVRLPLVIHSRDSSKEVVRILEEENAAEVGGVLHCLPADSELAEAGERMGFYLSLAGVITYDRGARHAIVKRADPERLLVETDCPYLTPVPKRGQRNEPAYVAHTVQKLAEMMVRSPREVDDLTTRNAIRAFRLEA
jgi:TatD DNase family protein